MPSLAMSCISQPRLLSPSARSSACAGCACCPGEVLAASPAASTAAALVLVVLVLRLDDEALVARHLADVEEQLGGKVLHHPHEIARRRDRRGQRSRRIVHDECCRRAAAALQRRRAVHVRVDPEGTRRMVRRELDNVSVLRLGADRQSRVVGWQRARGVQPVEVQVRDVWPLGAVGVTREAKPVAKANPQRVPRTHPQRRAWDPPTERSRAQAVHRADIVDHAEIESEVEHARSRRDHGRVCEAASHAAVGLGGGYGHGCGVVGRRHLGLDDTTDAGAELVDGRAPHQHSASSVRCPGSHR
eukprot:scaffold79139_cov60-Phaeocystis_antarctica.AAC.2